MLFFGAFGPPILAIFEAQGWPFIFVKAANCCTVSLRPNCDEYDHFL